MTWYIPSAGFFSKLLCSLLVVLIILQYIFGTVGHFNRRWDAMFYSAINTTRYANIYREAESRNDQVHWKAQEPYLELITNMNSNTSMNIAPITYYGNDSVPFGNVSIENFVTMPTCPPIPPNLHGRIEVKKVPVPLIKELETRFKWLKDGGHYAPSCITRSKIAIVVPYRARAEHLLLFLQHMHPFLKRQQIEYTIFIVEQNGDGPFNRAMLMNVGFKEALRTGQFDCFIFHDVDLLPEDDRNLYTCPEQPRHMSVAVDRFKYRLPYSTIFGGVSALTKDQFQTVNGFSNSFWGWGGEDDDMSNRIKFHNFHISRYPINIARYTMLTHQKEKANPKRYENLQQGKKKYNTDGLVNLKYEVVESRTNKLYTWFLVNLHKPS